MPLNREKIQSLKQAAMQLKPIVTVAGKGLTETVLAEIDRALYDHELVKIKLAGHEREARRAIIDEISQHHNAEVIHTIGHIAVFYRKSDKFVNKG